MNHHLLPSLSLALASGVLAPYGLVRARWTHHAPRLATAVWLALAVIFAPMAGLTLAQLVLAYEGTHELLDLFRAGLLWNIDLTTVSAPPPSIGAAALFVLTVTVLPYGVAAWTLRRSRQARARHATALWLVGRATPQWDATVVEDDTPAVYCLPGRLAQVVVTTGALRVLTDRQLAAALAHERAHITGHHHLLTASAQAFARTFPWLPLARQIGSQVPLLAEMMADDRALKGCSRETLATALRAIATGGPPRATRTTNASPARLRLRRLLAARRTAWPVTRGTCAVITVVAMAIPLLAICCWVPGHPGAAEARPTASHGGSHSAVPRAGTAAATTSLLSGVSPTPPTAQPSPSPDAWATAQGLAASVTAP